jgi:cold shock CspA family protein/ribosome-associated translation inhibitor RaiA
MQIPFDVTYRGVEKTDDLEALIQEKVDKLEEVCDHIMGCHIAVEKVHDRPSHGSPYRVRIDLTVPPGHELAVDKNPGEGNQYDPVDAVIREAFDAARKQLTKLNRKQQGEVKQHPEQQMAAIVTQLFPEEGYGFIKTLTGEEIYFHRNSVVLDDFDRLEIGTGVQFFLSEGNKGPQASTVKIVSKPGASIGTADETLVDSPLGWQ